MTVVIRDGLITDVGDALDIPRGSRIIDGANKFLIPGLWDMHVHLAALAPIPRAPEVLVSYGVTGVRDMGGIQDDLRRLQTEIETGSRIGPRMLMAGNTLNGAAPADFHSIVASDKDVRRTLDELVEWGADFVKIHRQLDPEIFHFLAEETRRRGLSLVGHVPQGVGLLEASNAGMLSFEHAEAWLEAELYRRNQPAGSLAAALARLSGEPGRELFRAIAANGTRITPTLSAYRAFIDAQETAEQREMGERLYARLAAVTVEAQRAGVTILAGTDFRSAPGKTLHDELVLLRDAGLSDGAALRAATVDAAEILGLDAGVVAVGTEASLVLLSANPLEDIANVSNVTAVVLGGQYLSYEDVLELRR